MNKENLIETLGEITIKQGDFSICILMVKKSSRQKQDLLIWVTYKTDFEARTRCRQFVWKVVPRITSKERVQLLWATGAQYC